MVDYIKFNESVKRIRIDVGTAGTAPNSALWIDKYKDIGVLGFEPEKRNFNTLIQGIETNQYITEKRIILKNKEILLNNKLVKNFSDNIFHIYNVAIDDVKDTTKKYFYSLEDEKNTCSSLLKPIENKLKTKIIHSEKIIVEPLSKYLNRINFEKFKYIEFLKTDTQGNDLNVIKSCGKYLEKICFIQMEYWAKQDYENEKSRQECLKESLLYMKKNDFKCYYYSDVDILFYNLKFKTLINKNIVIDDTIDFKNGLFQKSKWSFGIEGKLILLIKIKYLLIYLGIFNFIKRIFKFSLKTIVK